MNLDIALGLAFYSRDITAYFKGPAYAMPMVRRKVLQEITFLVDL